MQRLLRGSSSVAVVLPAREEVEDLPTHYSRVSALVNAATGAIVCSLQTGVTRVMCMTSKQAPEHHSFGSDGAPLPWGKWSAVTGPSSVQGRHLPPLGCCTAWRPLPLSSKQLTPSRGPSHERRAVESSQERAPELDRPVCRRRTALRWQASRGRGEATFPMPLAPKKAHETFFRKQPL